MRLPRFARNGHKGHKMLLFPYFTAKAVSIQINVFK